MDYKKFMYNTVLSQTYSECGNYLFVGNTFGDVFVFSIPQILSASELDADSSKVDVRNAFEPIQVFKAAEKHCIHSLAFHRNFLLVGTTGEICGFTWANNKLSKKAWTVAILAKPEAISFADVNYLWLDSAEDLLYAGCGDNSVYCISLDNGTTVRSYSGHKDYIHCVVGHGDKLYSASEDGRINMWDRRQNSLTGYLEPHKNSKLERPQFGKWQGSVAVTNDWLLCGGGPKASMWHLGSLECMKVFPFPDRVHVSNFVDDNILVAGHHKYVHQYSFNGDTTSEIPVSATAIYSVAWQTTPHKLMTMAGTSNEIDACLNFNYKDIVLRLYNK